MKFDFNPSTNKLTAYVAKEEFDLALNEKEFRVFSRVLNDKELSSFFREFLIFFKEVVNHLNKDNYEKLKSIKTGLKEFEKKYNLKSEEIWNLHQEKDEHYMTIPNDNLKTWLKLYEEFLSVQLGLKREKLTEEFISIWK